MVFISGCGTVVQTVGFGWLSQFGKAVKSRTEAGPRRTVATLVTMYDNPAYVLYIFKSSFSTQINSDIDFMIRAMSTNMDLLYVVILIMNLTLTLNSG